MRNKKEMKMFFYRENVMKMLKKRWKLKKMKWNKEIKFNDDENKHSEIFISFQFVFYFFRSSCRVMIFKRACFKMLKLF